MKQQITQQSQDRLADQTFLITIAAKGIGGLIELIAGLSLLFVSVVTLQHLAQPLEHVGLDIAHEINDKTKQFAIFYATSRGVLRAGLAYALLREKLWAYPAAIALLAATIVYQLWLILQHFSIGLTALTLLDFLIIGLTWYEYQKLKRGGHINRDFIR